MQKKKNRNHFGCHFLDSSSNSVEMSDCALLLSSLPAHAEASCSARIGLMGNPSDGFKGKTLSFLLDNFKATVFITAKDKEDGIEITEPVLFDNLDDLCKHSRNIVSCDENFTRKRNKWIVL